MNLKSIGRFTLLFQFLPLAVFVWFARKNGFSNMAWPAAFQVGAILSISQLIFYRLLGLKSSPFVIGVHFFLIVGGLGFLTGFEPILIALQHLRASAIILSIGFVCFVSVLNPRMAVFNVKFVSKKNTDRFSVWFLAFVILTFFFSHYFRQNIFLGGALTFVFLIVIKKYFEFRLRRQTQNEALATSKGRVAATVTIPPMATTKAAVPAAATASATAATSIPSSRLL